MSDSDPHLADARSELEKGRAAYAQHAWLDAYEALRRADEQTTLAVPDLELLAWSTALIGNDEELIQTFERLHRAALDAGDCQRAAHWAIWLGMRLSSLGEAARATGWLGRAQRLIEREGRDCVQQGYLLLPSVHRHLAGGDVEAAYATAAKAADIGERFKDADLVAMARNLQGHARVLQGNLEEGLALLDEAMVEATTRRLSPLITGLVYCNVIANCQRVYALDRAREWTTALAEWCKEQPQLVALKGICLVHRAEILELNGEWSDALVEARRASERFSHGLSPPSLAAAFYQQGEIHRLRGEFPAAEAAYRRASEFGREPQPGLALLRSAQKRGDAAVAAMRRVLGATSDRLQRAKLLPAHVEILLSVRNCEEVRAACDELEGIAASFDSEVLHAIASQARGSLLVAEGNAQGALPPLRRAFAAWQQLGAPYMAARVRLCIARACRALGDEEGTRLELDAARTVFAQLGATPDVLAVDAFEKRRGAQRAHGLTARELEVLRLLAAGKTNKAIAGDLALREKTVDRHVSNIFTKINVASRAAATAYAYENGLV